jgi:hypothetical protein
MKALDSETYIVIPGRAAPRLVVGQVADKTSERLLHPKEFRQALIDAHAFGEILAFFNAPFDLGVACAMFPELVPIVFEMLERGQILDAARRQALLDLGRGTLLEDAQGRPIEAYSLASVSEKVLGLYLAKEDTPRLHYAHLDGVPFEMWSDEDRAYAKRDARRTYDVVEAQGNGDPETDPGIANLKLEPRENRAAWALHLMSCWGPRTDPEMVEDVVKESTAQHERLIAKFTEVGVYRGEGWCRRKKQCEGKAPHLAGPGCWRPWLPNDVGTKDQGALKALVAAAYKGSPPSTDSGEVCCDRDSLLESGDPLLMKLGEQGAGETEYKTYLRVIQQGTRVPICVHYDPIKRTLRTGAWDPNIQNLPRIGRSRECFVARHTRFGDPYDSVWNSVDYPSLELVTLAQNLLWMFGQSALAELLNAGRDLHVNLASGLLGISYEEGIALHRAKDARMKLFRQASKPVNYAMGAAMSAEKLVVYCRQPGNGGVNFCKTEGHEHNKDTYVSERIGKPLCRPCVEVADKFRSAWFEMLPEMRRYHRRVGEECEDPRNSLIEVWGPGDEPVMWVRGRKFTEAANLRFQGLAARLAKDAIWRVAKACYYEKDSPLFGSRQVIFAHDESITEIPESLNVTAAADEHARLFEAAARYWCPDVACKPKPALMRRWFKNAGDVRDSKGKLNPWWPDDWSWAPDLSWMARDREAACV